MGSFGLFFTLFLIFVRVLPAVSIGEVKSVLGVGRTAGHGPASEKEAVPAPAKPGRTGEMEVA